eukprot:15336693-Ditylum_brightwellii.AAC.1
MTLTLPTARFQKILSLLNAIPHHLRRTSRNKWSRLVGSLRSIVPAITGGIGLFSLLQARLSGTCGRIRLTAKVHAELDDWRVLLHSLAARPTHIHEIVPLGATAFGYHDASGTALGGVYFLPDGTPHLWQELLPRE